MSGFSALARPDVEKLAVYEPGKPIEEVARELGFASEAEIVKLASNENALGPSPAALAAMQQAIRQVHRYPDGSCHFLRRGIAEHTGLAPENVLPGNGSNELIELLAHAFLGPGTSIVIAERAFLVYTLVADCFGAATVKVPMRHFVHDLDAMAEAIRPDTRLLFVGNPNNPTSTMVGAGEIERLMQRVPPHVIVCFDEAYVELLAPQEQPDTLRYVREGRTVVVLRTFSKTYGLAGLRLGYVLAPAECIRLLERVRQPFNVNLVAQAAAVAALGDTAHVERSRRMVADGLAALEAAFVRLGLEYVPAKANFILVRVGRGREVFQSLLKQGVIVRPMDPYGLPEHVRVTVGLPEENRKFLRALEATLKGGGRS